MDVPLLTHWLFPVMPVNMIRAQFDMMCVCAHTFFDTVPLPRTQLSHRNVVDNNNSSERQYCIICTVPFYIILWNNPINGRVFASIASAAWMKRKIGRHVFLFGKKWIERLWPILTIESTGKSDCFSIHRRMIAANKSICAQFGWNWSANIFIWWSDRQRRKTTHTRALGSFERLLLWSAFGRYNWRHCPISIY